MRTGKNLCTKVFYIKQQNTEGSEIKFSDNQSPSSWKFSVSTPSHRWTEYLVDLLTTTSIPKHPFSLSSTINASPVLAPFSLMSTALEVSTLLMCLEGFLYGKKSVLCTLTCTHTKEVQLFPVLGIYSGIFAIYLQHSSKESRTATIIFYALCLLYVLSAATVVSDLLSYTIEVSNNSICNSSIF